MLFRPLVDQCDCLFVGASSAPAAIANSSPSLTSSIFLWPMPTSSSEPAGPKHDRAARLLRTLAQPAAPSCRPQCVPASHPPSAWPCGPVLNFAEKPREVVLAPPASGRAACIDLVVMLAIRERQQLGPQVRVPRPRRDTPAALARGVLWMATGQHRINRSSSYSRHHAQNYRGDSRCHTSASRAA